MAAEIAFLALLIYRRAYRLLPLFCAYIAWGVVSDCCMLYVYYRYASHYFQAFIIETSLDTLVQYCVLVELAWAVLRPMNASLQRKALVGICVVFILLGAVVWQFSDTSSFLGFPPKWHFLAHLQQSIAVLRILFFLGLVAGSHILAIGWRDRELQVATGLGVYSIVSLAGAIVHTHQTLSSGNYHIVDGIISGSYIVSLSYWLVCFAYKEAPRRDFTPQMRNLVVAVAGAARVQRDAITSSVSSNGASGSGS